MKKRTYPPKRVTLLSLLIRAVCVTAVLSTAFACLCDAYLKQTIHQQASEQIEAQTNQIQQYISSVQSETDPRFHMQEISARMAVYLYYDIMIDDPLTSDPNKGLVQIVPPYSPDCYIAGALVDKDSNIVASNRQILLTFIKFGDDSDNAWYVCDNEFLQMPEMDKLYADFKELTQKNGMYYYSEMQLKSAYINKETHTFIPHEVMIADYPNVKVEGPLAISTDESEVTMHEINITAEKEGYELTELHQGIGSEYPRSMLFYFHGTEQEKFERFNDLAYHGDRNGYFSSGYHETENGAVYSRDVPVYVDGEKYYLCVRFAVNGNVPQVRKLFWKWTVLFTALVTVIALLWCWRKNVLNKAEYAFEDYQRDLTDRLAHDIKTPLMAISGYAENIQKGSLTEQEQQEYLNAILDNVAFTDSLISRTLFLNHIEGKNTLKRETIQLESLVEEIMRKYELMLDEKNITYNISGTVSLNGGRTSLETILENLISNAVKYTPENGSVNVTLDKKHLAVANTVTEKINTKELKRPFVRGDESRSNVKGNGLGLSIADRTADASGYKLSLSCTDAEFKAELRF